LCNGFTPHDVIGLGQEALVAQYEARLASFEYVDALWDKAKANCLDPANDPRFSAVAGLCDLIQELLSSAEHTGGGDQIRYGRHRHGPDQAEELSHR